MKMLSKFCCVEIHNRHNSEHSTHITLQCIQGLKTEVYAQPDIF